MLTILIVALVAVSGLGSEATHPVVLLTYRSLIFAVGAICLRDLSREQRVSVSPFFLAMAASAWLLMLSFLRNPSWSDGFYVWYQFVLFSAMFVLLGLSSRNRSVEWKNRLLWLLVAVQGVYAVAALIFNKRPITGGFVNPNYFASFLLVGLSICLAMIAFRKEPLPRFAGIAGALVFYYAITQTSSRGASIVAIVLTLVITIRYARCASISRAKIALSVGGLLLIGAIASPQLVRKFADRGVNDPYNYARPRVWLGVLHLIGDHPFFGVGLAQFIHVSRQYTLPLEGPVGRYVTRPGIAHSEYLQYAAEAGIPVAILVIFLSLYLTCIAIRRARSCTADLRAVQESAVLVAIGLMVHALVDNNWKVPVIAAGLSVFALGDVVPGGRVPLQLRWTFKRGVVAAVIAVFVYAHSTLIPASALWFQDVANRAYIANDFPRAESNYLLAASILPSDSEVLDTTASYYLSRYRVQADKKFLDNAESFLSRAIKANPNAEAPLRHLESVLIERLTGDPHLDAAIHPRIAATDRELLRVDPFNPFVRKNLAEALHNTGEYRQAEEELQRALQLEPNYVPAYLTLARWKGEQGNNELAERYRQQALAIVSKNASLRTKERYEALLLGRPDPGQR